MADLTKKAAYLKGLFDGLKLNENEDINKVLGSVIDFLDEAAEKIDMIDDEQEFFAVRIDELEESIDDLSDSFDELAEDFDNVTESLDELYDEEYDDDGLLQIKCDNCGAEVLFDDDDIDDILGGKFECPECGEIIELPFDVHDHGCDCGCEHEDE